MKKYFLVALVSAIALTANSQTLRINMGDVTYAIPAAQAGEMLYDNATTLTVGKKSYPISAITNITIDDSSVSDNTVNVSYNGNTAHVEISGNIAPYITAEVNGSHVNVSASASLENEVTYTLSGNSSNGSFYMEGSTAMGLVLNGLFGESRGNPASRRDKSLCAQDDFGNLVFGKVTPDGPHVLVLQVQAARFHKEPEYEFLVFYLVQVWEEPCWHVERGYQQVVWVVKRVQCDNDFGRKLCHLERNGKERCVVAEHVARYLQVQLQRVAIWRKHVEICGLESVVVVEDFFHVKDFAVVLVDEPLRL